MRTIRQAAMEDSIRLAEIEVFNYRLNFYPIFRNDEYYFQELQVPTVAEKYQNAPELLERTYVYDDGVVKAFIRLNGRQVEKLFVEPALQGNSIGGKLLEFAICEKEADFLWALEKNTKAISFYQRHGFFPTEEKQLEEDTEEYLVKLKRQ